MLKPDSKHRSDKGFIYNLYFRLARASLRWERLWPALWPTVALAGVFCAAALLELFSYLPIWLHAGVVVAFLVGFLASLQKAINRMPRVKDIQAQHHIEQASNLEHRPLAALGDTLAAGQQDAQARALWQAHQDRMAAETDSLKLGLPKASLAKRDPWGLRSAVALLLLVGVVAAGSDSFNRLSRAIMPELNALTMGRTIAINIWITPPAYTGVPPIILSAGTKATENQSTETQPKEIIVPAGSTILAQFNGGGALPQLSIGKVVNTSNTLDFNRIEADAYHLEAELGRDQFETGNRLSVIQNGHEMAGWPLVIKEDSSPVVEFSGAPEATPQLRLQLPFSAKDDYGVKTVTASIRRLDGKKIPGGEDEIILRLPLPGQENTNIKGKSNHDLVSHVWAGLPVLVHLLAQDEKSQTGLSQVEPVVLPERQFGHPTAKELYEIRKHLLAEQRSRILAALKLDQLSEEPKLFDGNNAIYLGLRVARERLKRDHREIAVVQVQKMLWDMALRIEEGLAATAGAVLRAAQRRLAEALDRNASTKEIERLMNEVQKALEKFMSSLMRELQQRGQLQQMDPNSQTMTSKDIQRMMDRARELMRQGSRDAAKQLMAELQRMLENLRSALSRGGRPQSPQSKQAQQTMKELRDIIRRQQKLLDETHKRSQRDPAEREQEGKKDTEGLEDQKGIRRQLGKMMQKFGEMMGKIPKGLGDAERAMQQAEKLLGNGRQGESVGPQGRALDALRKGAQNSARALAGRMGRGRGRANGQRGPGGRFGAFNGPRLEGMRPGNRDPFGRRQQEEGNQGTASGRVKIPGEREMQRAREILQELRRRAGDLWRPEIELDYIERLLKRF